MLPGVGLSARRLLFRARTKVVCHRIRRDAPSVRVAVQKNSACSDRRLPCRPHSGMGDWKTRLHAYRRKKIRLRLLLHSRPVLPRALVHFFHFGISGSGIEDRREHDSDLVQLLVRQLIEEAVQFFAGAHARNVTPSGPDACVLERLRDDANPLSALK